MILAKDAQRYKRILEAFNVAIDRVYRSGRPDADALMAELWQRKYSLVRQLLLARDAADLRFRHPIRNSNVDVAEDIAKNTGVEADILGVTRGGASCFAV